MSTASQTASQVAHDWPTTTFLRPPAFTSLASGGTSMVVPAQVFVGPAPPDALPHWSPKAAPLFDVSVPAKPMVTPVRREPGSVAEIMLVVVVVIVTAHILLVRVFDGAGRILARVG